MSHVLFQIIELQPDSIDPPCAFFDTVALQLITKSPATTKCEFADLLASLPRRCTWAVDETRKRKKKDVRVCKRRRVTWSECFMARSQKNVVFVWENLVWGAVEGFPVIPWAMAEGSQAPWLPVVNIRETWRNKYTNIFRDLKKQIFIPVVYNDELFAMGGRKGSQMLLQFDFRLQDWVKVSCLFSLSPWKK